jgi:hypothetical protein
LKEDWFVITKEGKYHKLKYNQTYSFPLIVEGWKELKNYEEFPDNVQVVFGYYGGSIFGIVAFKEISCPDEIPAFHSRSLDPKLTTWFDVVIEKGSTSDKKLVK